MHQSCRVALFIGLAAMSGISLIGCVNHQPLSPQQQLNLALGVAQTKHVQQAEKLLLEAQQGFASSQNKQGEAQTWFALGELYKSQRFQQTLTPPATLNAYQQSADAYQQAAVRYELLQRFDLEAAAYLGQANAYLLADQLKKACPAFEQAQDVRIKAQTQGQASDSLEQGLRFFADLAVVCAVQSQH